MAVYHWVPTAPNTPEIVTATVDATVIRLRGTIGGVVITGAIGANCVAAVENFLDAVRTANHPYFNQYRYAWSGTVAGGTLTLTAAQSGVPVADSGTSTIQTYIASWSAAASVTAAGGRCFFDDVRNWRDADGAIPASVPGADTIIIDNTRDGILWGFSSTLDCTALEIRSGFTGCFGLNYFNCTLNYNGTNVSAEVPEYRSEKLLAARALERLIIGGSPIRFNLQIEQEDDWIVRCDCRARQPQSDAPGQVMLWINDDSFAADEVPRWQINGGNVWVSSLSSADAFCKPIIRQADGSLIISGDEQSVSASPIFGSIYQSGGRFIPRGMSINNLYQSGGNCIVDQLLIKTAHTIYGGEIDWRDATFVDVGSAALTINGGNIRNEMGAVLAEYATATVGTASLDSQGANIEISDQFIPSSLAIGTSFDGIVEYII